MNILKLTCHKLRIADGLTLVPPNLRGWEAFPTPGALTHTRITWALSPMAPQVLGVILGPPYAHGVLGTPYGGMRNIWLIDSQHGVEVSKKIQLMIEWDDPNHQKEKLKV